MSVPYTEETKEIMISLSNRVMDRIKKGSEHQLRYEEILAHIAQTRLRKCELYGEDRYESRHDDEFNAWMCFSDVYRKFIRLEQLTKLYANGDEEAGKALKDAYLDIANYGIAGFQILTQEKTNDKD